MHRRASSMLRQRPAAALTSAVCAAHLYICYIDHLMINGVVIACNWDRSIISSMDDDGWPRRVRVGQWCDLWRPQGAPLKQFILLPFHGWPAFAYKVVDKNNNKNALMDAMWHFHNGCAQADRCALVLFGACSDICMLWFHNAEIFIIITFDCSWCNVFHVINLSAAPANNYTVRSHSRTHTIRSARVPVQAWPAELKPAQQRQQ